MYCSISTTEKERKDITYCRCEQQICGYYSDDDRPQLLPDDETCMYMWDNPIT